MILIIIAIYISTICFGPRWRKPENLGDRFTALVTAFSSIRYYIKDYYDNNENITNESFVEFITTHSLVYSKKAPINKGKINENLSIGVHLLLTNSLESDSPTLIAYTDPIYHPLLENKQQIAMFLHENSISIVTIDDYKMTTIIGKKIIKRKIVPDLYIILGRDD